MIATQPVQAETIHDCPMIPTGVDTGAGLVKLILGSGAVLSLRINALWRQSLIANHCRYRTPKTMTQ